MVILLLDGIVTVDVLKQEENSESIPCLLEHEGLGAVLQVGYRDKAPGGGFRGAKPTEADEILAIKAVSLH